MNDWPKDNSPEANALRAELSGMNSPLAKLVEGLPQDKSLERIDYALNLVGEDFGILNLIKDEAHASEIFEQIKDLTNIDGPKELKAATEEIVRKINEISDSE